MSLPLIIGGVCILTSIIGTYFVRLGAKQSIMGALYKGFWTTAILSVPALYYVTTQTLGDMNAAIGAIGKTTETYTGMDLFYCMMVGLGVTGMLVWRSDEHTSELPSLMRITYAVFCLKK